MTEVAKYEWEDAVDGTEGEVSAAVPYLTILQAMSPAVQDEEPGAKPGELYQSATGEIFSGADGVCVQPCYVQTLFVEWAPREAEGGLVARHEPSSEFVRAAISANGQSWGKIPVPGSDNILRETKYLYALMEGEDGPEQIVISFSSSKIKKLREFLKRVKMLRGKPKLFQLLVRVTTEKEKNDLGTFHNFNLEVERVLTNEKDADMIGEGYAFSKEVRDTDLALGSEAVERPMIEPPKASKELEDEIPF